MGHTSCELEINDNIIILIVMDIFIILMKITNEVFQFYRSWVSQPCSADLDRKNTRCSRHTWVVFISIVIGRSMVFIKEWRLIRSPSWISLRSLIMLTYHRDYWAQQGFRWHLEAELVACLVVWPMFQMSPGIIIMKIMSTPRSSSSSPHASLPQHWW